MATAGDPSRSASALDVLREQHALLEGQLAALDAHLAALTWPAAPAALEALDAEFLQLAEAVAAHVAMEERVFYRAVRARQVDETLVDARHEHGAIKAALDVLHARGVAHECFRAHLQELGEHLSGHAHHEEEEVLFPKVAQLFSEEELVALGREMAALFEQLRRRPEASRWRR